MSAFDELVAKIPPPGGPFAYDWASVEEELGTGLPADFKALLEAYGPGEFDETFTVFGPADSGSPADLVTFAREEAEIIRSVRDEFVFAAGTSVRLLVFPETGGLLAWGSVPTGLALHWQTDGAPDDWPVVVSDDKSTAGETWRYDGTATEFLLGVFAGSIEVPYLEGTDYARGNPPRFEAFGEHDDSG
jgi:hypothetical protein